MAEVARIGNEETLLLKYYSMRMKLFRATAEAFRTLDYKAFDRGDADAREAFGVFSGLYSLVEELGIENDYQRWKERNGYTEANI